MTDGTAVRTEGEPVLEGQAVFKGPRGVRKLVNRLLSNE